MVVKRHLIYDQNKMSVLENGRGSFGLVFYDIFRKYTKETRLERSRRILSYELGHRDIVLS